MKERPILFSGPMIRVILADQKTQTRRVVKSPYQPSIHTSSVVPARRDCPYGQPDDRLWVRETWRQSEHGIEYRADTGSDGPVDGRADGESTRWRPSIFMPRWASRITLEITSVRVERVQDISNEDAIAEGCRVHVRSAARLCFSQLWNEINGKRGYGWAVNPWVWAMTFKRVV